MNSSDELLQERKPTDYPVDCQLKASSWKIYPEGRIKIKVLSQSQVSVYIKKEHLSTGQPVLMLSPQAGTFVPWMKV